MAGVGSQSAGAASNAPAGGVTSSGTSSDSSVSKEDYTIESWDGTELGATLYTPAEEGPNPAVLMTHGWGSFRQSPITAPKAYNYAENGYTVLTYDSRGFASSGGTNTLAGENEVKDTRRLIDWLANRPEVATEGADNPYIGMDGISYAGGIQYQVAAVDDRLNALVPRMTWYDIEHALVPDGVVKIGWLSALFGLGEFHAMVDGDAELTDDLGDWYWHAFENNEAPEDAIRKFEDISLAFDDEIDTPTFLLQGWHDSLFTPSQALGAYEELQDAGVESRIGFYDGGHDLSEAFVDFDDRGRMNDDTVVWMDQHVHPDRSGDVPQVQNFLPQREEWRTDETWPPEEVTYEEYELGSASQDGENKIEQGWFFPNEEVTYEWTVDEDIEVIGEPEIDIELDVHGPEARVFFELYHNGSNINGMDEVARLDSSGTHTITRRYPGIQQFVSSGDTIGLNVSVTNTWYLDSRDSDGVTVKPNGSKLWVPQRPDENAPEDDDEGCFITTATAREPATLNSLRRFRDESMKNTPVGRGLVGLYYRISPPIAETLSRHPDSKATGVTRWLVERCASLSDEQAETSSAPKSIFLGIILTLLYIVGILVAAGGHAGLKLKEWLSAA